MDTGYIQLTLSSTELPTMPFADPAAFLMFLQPLSLKVTWLDAPESAIYMSDLVNISMVVTSFLTSSPYSFLGEWAGP
jgi:hypothetical protein